MIDLIPKYIAIVCTKNITKVRINPRLTISVLGRLHILNVYVVNWFEKNFELPVDEPYVM